MTLGIYCFYECEEKDKKDKKDEKDENKIVGYKIRRIDGEKLPNGRKYTTNKFLTKEEAYRRLALVELSEMHRDM